MGEAASVFFVFVFQGGRSFLVFAWQILTTIFVWSFFLLHTRKLVLGRAPRYVYCSTL